MRGLTTLVTVLFCLFVVSTASAQETPAAEDKKAEPKANTETKKAPPASISLPVEEEDQDDSDDSDDG